MSVATEAELISVESGKVFCSFYTPENAHSTALLIQPFGQHYYRAHLFYRRLAKQLAQIGYLVCRLDCRGVGDASGEFIEITSHSLQKDISAALAALQFRGGSLPAWVVALDWAAVPILQVCSQLPDMQTGLGKPTKLWGLVLIEPPLVGDLYWQQQLIWQQALLCDTSRFRNPRQIISSPGSVEIIGHCYADAWIKQIKLTQPINYLAGLLIKQRISMGTSDCLQAIKTHLQSQNQTRIQDHFIELTTGLINYDPVRVDQSIQAPQCLQLLPELMLRLR